MHFNKNVAFESEHDSGFHVDCSQTENCPMYLFVYVTWVNIGEVKILHKDISTLSQIEN